MEKSVIVTILKGVMIAGLLTIIYRFAEAFIYLRIFIFAMLFFGYILMSFANFELYEGIQKDLKQIEYRNESKIQELNKKIDILTEKIDSINKTDS